MAMNVLELFTRIRTFVFDVDGVLTDGTVQLLPNGEQSRKMSIRDGYALQLAVKKRLPHSGDLRRPLRKRNIAAQRPGR